MDSPNDFRSDLFYEADTSRPIHSPIREFYDGKSILISGATGFIGKFVLEKLIRTCNVDQIYVLIRPKKGQTPQGRLNEILDSVIFSAVRRGPSSERLTRVKAITGDLLLPDLGIDDSDRKEIIDNVNVVFHSAASVKFNDPIKKAADYNIVGTNRMIDLCAEMNSLESFVHVSTAYAFCEQSEVEERLYPIDVCPQKFINSMGEMSEDEAEKLTPKLLGTCPNTYTFTKGITEHLLADRFRKLNIPFAIARPSIVIHSMREPDEGLMDSVNGPTGVSILCSLGICRTGLVGFDKKVDIIPVDIVSNSLISLGWYAASCRPSTPLRGNERIRPSLSAPNHEPIYNITTGALNPITWGEYFDIGRVCAINTPSMKVIRPIARVPHNPSKLRVDVVRFFSEFMFAWMVDQILGLMGHKKFMVRLIRKMHVGFEHMDFFSSRDWDFKSDNLLRVMSSMTPDDRQAFHMDVRAINWPYFMQKCMLGIRRLILKEDDSTIDYARKRYRRLAFGYRAFQILIAMFVYWMFIRSSWIGCTLASTASYMFYTSPENQPRACDQLNCF